MRNEWRRDIFFRWSEWNEDGWGDATWMKYKQHKTTASIAVAINWITSTSESKAKQAFWDVW